MRSATVTKHEFLTVGRANRDQHRHVFEQALDGYRRRITRELERRLQDLGRGRRTDQYIGPPEPEDDTVDYDRVIAMGEMSIDDEVTLEASEFGMYVMDQWHSKQSLTESTGRYLR